MFRVFISTAVYAAEQLLPATIDFNRDVRPILSNNCFAYHGPDSSKREAELRLDLRDDAVKQKAIVSKSLLVKHIYSTKADEQISPPESNKKLTEQQKSRSPPARMASTSWSASGLRKLVSNHKKTTSGYVKSGSLWRQQDEN